jgi:uncharacterized protein YdaU (DUF1376 family)
MPKAYLPLYTGDYLKKTRHRLTTWQHGAYMLLIMEQWDCESPIDFKTACKVVEAYTSKQMSDLLFILRHFFTPVQKVGETVQNFDFDDFIEKNSENFQKNDENYSKIIRKKLLNTHEIMWENKRLKKELDKYQEGEAKRKRAGSKGGKQRAKNAQNTPSDSQAMLEAVLKQSESESESYKKNIQKKKNPKKNTELVFFNEQGKPAQTTDWFKSLEKEEERTFFLQANEYLSRNCQDKPVCLADFGDVIFKITRWQAKGVNHADYLHFEEGEVRAKCFIRAVDGMFKNDLGRVQSLKAFLFGAFKQNWKEWLPPESKAQRR